MSRHRTRTTCIFMDVNDLKKINDNHGHKAGDLMLTTIANAIKHHIRALDFVYRHGGDEFVAILPETTHADGNHIVQRLTQYLKNTPVEVASGVFETFSISCGVAVLESGALSKPGPAAHNSEEQLYALALHDLTALINEADKLMYVAKKEYKAMPWQVLWKKLAEAVKRRRDREF